MEKNLELILNSNSGLNKIAVAMAAPISVGSLVQSSRDIFARHPMIFNEMPVVDSGGMPGGPESFYNPRGITRITFTP